MSRLTSRRCAVVGATGFIGSHLSERLVADGAHVLAIARSNTRRARLASIERQLEFAACDVMVDGALAPVLTRFAPDIVFHLADHPDGAETFSQMRRAIVVNALGAVGVLEAATAAGADLFVHGDSAKVYGNGPAPFRADEPVQPICSYAVAKAAAWQLCQVAAASGGPAIVGLRPTLVYGPRQGANLIEYVRSCAAAGRPVRLLGGEQTRDPLFVADAVDAFVLAATAPAARGHAIPIGGGQEISVVDLANRVTRALGCAGTFEPPAPPRTTEIWRCVADNRDADRLLGWRPSTSLDAGLARTFSSPA